MKRYVLFLFTLVALQCANAVRTNVDGLYYTLNRESHEAVISYGNTCSGDLDIPSEVIYEGEVYVVKSMIWNAFNDCSGLTKVKIPKTLESIMHGYPYDPDDPDVPAILYLSDNPFIGCTALESIEVDEENPGMKSVGGVLFSKDGTSLYAYPSGIKAASYDVPEGVVQIGAFALANDHLRKIDLAGSVQRIVLKMCADASLDTLIVRGRNVEDMSMRGWFLRCLKETAKLYVPASEIDRYKGFFAGEVLSLEEYKAEQPVTFTEGQMATIVLPTEPDASKGKYYRLDRVEGNEIIFEQELQPRAHVPYIIVPGEDFSIEVSAMELDGLRSDTASVDGVRFIGTFQKEEVETGEGFYIELIDQTPDCSFSASGEAGRDVYTIGTLRAYLLVHWDDPYSHGGTKTPAEKLEIVLHDDATGIESIQNSKFKVQNEDAAIYDLSGRKIVNGKSSNGKFPRGIYIEGGKIKIY